MNLAQVISRTYARHPGKTAIAFQGRRYSYDELNEEIRKRALLLTRLGIRRGDRVALRLPKGMEFIFLHLAALSVGAVTLPLNPAYSAEDLSYYLADSQSALLITEAAHFAGLDRLRASLPGLKILLLDGPSPAGWDPLPAELQKTGSEDPRTYPAQDDDLAMLLYTSGTTGRSKGAMISHRNLVSNMRSIQQAWNWTEQDVLLHVLPLFHIHGLVIALHGSLHAGSTVFLAEKFDVQSAWEVLVREKCTLMMGVPTIYHRMLKQDIPGRARLQAMRLFISGSAPLPETLFHRFAAQTGFKILDRYGMTEAGIIASNPLDPASRRPKSVGFPLPGVEVRIFSEKGERVPPGEVGEVCMRGDNIFRGYWNMPEKTRESLHDGWFRSGDLGYEDPRDGRRLYLVGRAKEIIITGGYNVYPKEVENVLEQHSAIQEAAVFGLPDEDFGEKVTAAVVLHPGETPPAAGMIHSFCKQHLAGYKCPKQIVVVDCLPRNAMGKVQKSLFQKQFTASAYQEKESPRVEPPRPI